MASADTVAAALGLRRAPHGCGRGGTQRTGFQRPQNLPLAAGFMVLQRENVPRRFICAIKEATDLICVTVIPVQPFSKVLSHTVALTVGSYA